MPKAETTAAGACWWIYHNLACQKNVRLEPHPGMPDVMQFDATTDFPAKVLFWRNADETRCRHRNLLFDPSVGVTIDTLMVDRLHTLNLGPAQVWVAHALWAIIVADVFWAGTLGETLHHQSVQRSKTELWAWYKTARTERPHETVMEVQNLTLSMLGGKPSTPSLRAKAAETKGLVPFVVHLLKKYRNNMMNGKKDLLIGAGEALHKYFELLSPSPLVVPMDTLQTMCDNVKTRIRLSVLAGIPLKPKHHLLLHLVARSAGHGNPTSYATFADEGISRVLKKIGQAAHRSVMEVRVFFHFGHIGDEKRGRKRPNPA